MCFLTTDIITVLGQKTQGYVRICPCGDIDEMSVRLTSIDMCTSSVVDCLF